MGKHISEDVRVGVAFGPDSIELGIRERVREVIQTIVNEELAAALGASASTRVDGRQGYRHGTRPRTVTSSLGPTTIARLNTVRGLLRELGVFIPVGSRQVVPAVWALLEDADSELPDTLRATFAEACQEIRDIEARIGNEPGKLYRDELLNPYHPPGGAPSYGAEP